MLSKIFKFLTKSGKQATDAVGKSMDFVDDVLEKEYITNTVDGIKDVTGEIVEKAGTVYQKSVDMVQDNVKVDALKTKVTEFVDKGKDMTSDFVEKGKDLTSDMVEKGKDITSDIVEKGKDLTEDLAEEMGDTASTLKNVMKEGEDFVKKIIDKDEEESGDE